MKRLIKLLKQVQGYFLMLASIQAGIDDFSMNNNWDKNASLWQNAYNIFIKD